MRFSAIFQLPAVPSQAAAQAAATRVEGPAEDTPAAPAAQLPEELDLDVRVRLVGEWQLGEGY